MIAKVADPGARIRYASMYCTGLVELHKYKEALGPLNETIKVAKNTHGAAYPTIATTAKISALSGIGERQQALALADEEMQRVSGYHLTEHLYEAFQTRAGVYEGMGQWERAISDYGQAIAYAKQLLYWRGVTQVDGFLAKAHLHQGELQLALKAINEAIDANEHIPDELYFVPRDLAIKAEIVARMGDLKSSNQLYEKSADMLDALLNKAPTPTIERQLISDLSGVYSQYFESLSNQGRTADAFRAIERGRGRVETQSLSHHKVITPHQRNASDQRLTELNLALLNTEESSVRGNILEEIYETEQQITAGSPAQDSPPSPVELGKLQVDLRPSELFIEYVLNAPQSYALAVTRQTVRRYTIPPKDVLEQEATQYRAEVLQQRTDMPLARQLFEDLLGRIPEAKEKQELILVPDGKLHQLPFDAIAIGDHYLLASHVVTVVPSGTVLDILRQRTDQNEGDQLPCVGVAAWTDKPPSQNTMLASIRRAVSGPDRKEFIALPESRHEVETIAADLPSPNTILLGNQATETSSKQLPLRQYNVIHLALHGYADAEFPDRSALVFAPEGRRTDDGLLQVREIRNLHLNASLVTLSACNTGVGPVGEEGVANIVNAFVEAGAHGVVSSLWELEDHATTHLMTVFYAHLGHHEEKAEALRQAQLEMLKSGSPPYYWAIRNTFHLASPYLWTVPAILHGRDRRLSGLSEEVF